jgi:gluconate 5-dehydrogenase
MVDVRDWMSLDGHVAIVTGGARGIGRETAETLAAAGARVVLADRDKEKVEGAAGEIRALGYRAVPIVADGSTFSSTTPALRSGAQRSILRLAIGTRSYRST